MTRYFFDLRVGDAFSPDDEGLELDGVEAARTELINAFPIIAAQHIRSDGDRAEFAMTVRDDAGDHVIAASLSFVLTRA